METMSMMLLEHNGGIYHPPKSRFFLQDNRDPKVFVRCSMLLSTTPTTRCILISPWFLSFFGSVYQLFSLPWMTAALVLGSARFSNFFLCRTGTTGRPARSHLFLLYHFAMFFVLFFINTEKHPTKGLSHLLSHWPKKVANSELEHRCWCSKRGEKNHQERRTNPWHKAGPKDHPKINGYIDHPKINFNISPLAKHQSEMQFASLGYTMLILHPIK